MGEEIGKMHSFGIIHGDLTTSNMILDGDDVHLIDFGLGHFSKRVEDMATDLRVLQEALTSTHNRISGRCWSRVMSGYRTNPSWEAVDRRMGKIESRGRYKKRAN
jgi:N6-L-threonylcarbamoyladenine synthase/protein kinase Bud32